MRVVSKMLLVLCFSVAGKGVFAQCDSSLWAHVYHSYRLHVNTPCMAVTGTVYSLIYEADGDIHIRLTVDSPYTYMLNSYNYSGELGKLICEPVCATTVTQADAVSSCVSFTNSVYIPSVGEHVQVIGPYVTDNDHGWNELHPVTSIKLTSKLAAPSVTPAKAPEVTVFPNPANRGVVNFKFSDRLSSIAYISIFSEDGRNAGQYQMLETQNLQITTTYLPNGKYFYHILQDHKEIAVGSFVVKN